MEIPTLLRRRYTLRHYHPEGSSCSAAAVVAGCSSADTEETGCSSFLGSVAAGGKLAELVVCRLE